jgi:hypothetical protein
MAAIARLGMLHRPLVACCSAAGGGWWRPLTGRRRPGVGRRGGHVLDVAAAEGAAGPGDHDAAVPEVPLKWRVFTDPKSGTRRPEYAGS